MFSAAFILDQGVSICHLLPDATLEWEQPLIWAFDFVFGLQEFFTPWFARALGTLIDRVANSKTVIAGPFGAGARELLTCPTGLEELAFERSVLAP